VHAVGAGGRAQLGLLLSVVTVLVGAVAGMGELPDRGRRKVGDLSSVCYMHLLPHCRMHCRIPVPTSWLLCCRSSWAKSTARSTSTASSACSTASWATPRCVLVLASLTSVWSGSPPCRRTVWGPLCGGETCWYCLRFASIAMGPHTPSRSIRATVPHRCACRRACCCGLHDSVMLSMPRL